MSTFGQLETGKRGLQTHQRALSTVAHNISNSSTEGYSRQRVQIKPTAPIYASDLSHAERAGQIGTGAAISRIERVRDFFLDNRILKSQQQVSYWQMRSKYLKQVDRIYAENDGNSTRKLVDQFWEAWQNLSVDPSNLDARQQISYRGQTLMEHINLRFERLHGLRKQINEEIRIQVNEINDLTDNIGKLNQEIQRSLAIGDQPNDLMDQRDLLVERLSEYINIRTDLRDTDEFQVHTSGFRLVQGADVQQFALRSNPPDDGPNDSAGYFQVVWPKSSGNTLSEYEEVQLESGSLKALLDLRDVDLVQEIRQLDEWTMTYVANVNEIHSSGMGLNGKSGLDFFEVFNETSNPLGNYDSTGDGNFDQTRIYQISGTQTLKPNDTLGISGELTLGAAGNPEAPNGRLTIPYNANNTVRAVLERINQSGADVKARLDHNGRLQLHATAQTNFALSYLEDSSYFLTQYSGLLQSEGQPGNVYDSTLPNQALLLANPEQGNPVNGQAKWQVQLQRNPSSSVRVNPAIMRDPSSISASKLEAPNTPGIQNPQRSPLADNRTALEIAALAHQPLMFGNRETMSDFFAANIAEIGSKEHQAELFQDTFSGELKELEDMRKEISGVNLDEEFTNMVKFQNGYNAAARFIATFGRLMDVLIEQVGT